MNQATKRVIRHRQKGGFEMTIIDGESFEAAIANTLKPPKKEPVEVPEDLAAAFDELPEEKKAAFKRSAEIWLPEETPERQAGEGRATYVLRCQKEKENREVVIGQRTFEAFARTLKTSKVEKMGAMIVESIKADGEKRKARQAIEDKEKANEAEIREAREKQRKREWGGGGGYGGISEV